ncbi:MAG: DUF2069 domain-containing protein [Betaproteobacteria bacterium]|nr:DUF2069 domain-containing protein [Betaproteobacteria bacterium]
MNKTDALHNAGIASLIALIFLCLTWELWLAPLRPGGSALVFKVLPLLLPLPGILRGRRYTFQWSSMLILLYLTEGVVRFMSENGLSAILAGAEIALAAGFFFSAVFYARLSASAKRA